MLSRSLALVPPILAPGSPFNPASIGDLLQLLVAYGDSRFVEEIGRMAEHRLRWVIERDTRQV